jgi:hypothetical protein
MEKSVFVKKIASATAGIALFLTLSYSDAKTPQKSSFLSCKPTTENIVKNTLNSIPLDSENLKACLKDAKVVFFGEAHFFNSHRDMLSDSLHLFIDAGIKIIGMEYLDTTYRKEVELFADDKVTKRFAEKIYFYSISNPVNRYSVWNLLSKAKENGITFVCTGATSDKKLPINLNTEFDRYIDTVSKVNSQLIFSYVNSNEDVKFLQLGGLAHGWPIDSTLNSMGIRTKTLRPVTLAELNHKSNLRPTKGDEKFKSRFTPEQDMLIKLKEELIQQAQPGPILLLKETNPWMSNDIILYSNNEDKMIEDYKLDSSVIDYINAIRESQPFFDSYTK